MPWYGSRDLFTDMIGFDDARQVVRFIAANSTVYRVSAILEWKSAIFSFT